MLILCSFVQELSRSDWGFDIEDQHLQPQAVPLHDLEMFRFAQHDEKIPSASPYPLCKKGNIIGVNKYLPC